MFASHALKTWSDLFLPMNQNENRVATRQFVATNYVLAIRVYIVLNWLPVDDMPSFRDIYLSKKNVILPLNTKPLFVILRCERKHCSDCHVIQQLRNWTREIRFPFQLIKSSVFIWSTISFSNGGWRIMKWCNITISQRTLMLMTLRFADEVPGWHHTLHCIANFSYCKYSRYRVALGLFPIYFCFVWRLEVSHILTF